MPLPSIAESQLSTQQAVRRRQTVQTASRADLGLRGGSLPPSSLQFGQDRQFKVLRHPKFKISGNTDHQAAACAQDLGRMAVHLCASLPWVLCPVGWSALGGIPHCHLGSLTEQTGSNRFTETAQVQHCLGQDKPGVQLHSRGGQHIRNLCQGTPSDPVVQKYF